MATTIAPPPVEIELEDLGRGGGGIPNLGWEGPGGPGGGAERVPDNRYRTGMWAALAGILMIFTAFTSAYVVRKGLSDDWIPTSLPSLIWFNTLLLMASSLTLERARQVLSDNSRFSRWWLLTTVLGAAFLVGQVVVWRQLIGDGVYISSNPSSSFFYVLTGAHAVHLSGGLFALGFLLFRNRENPFGSMNRIPIDVMAIYWHFMDALWIYLLLLLFFWR
jgi:cytochrome c oxidase subunit 3